MAYVEYLPGEKHGASTPNRSDFPDTFRDAGLEIAPDEIVVDIDHIPKESIKAMISIFNIHTQTVWTARGAHLWFKRPVTKARVKVNGICRLGFDIECHTKHSRPAGMTIKRDGVMRDIDNNGMRQVMPDIFTIGTKRNPYQNMIGMEEGDGRNQTMFKHRQALGNCADWEKILRFINDYVFADPMSDDEFNTVARDADISTTKQDHYWLRNHVIDEYKTVVYKDIIWFYDNGRYISAGSNDIRLRVIVAAMCEDQDTKYLNEVMNQIKDHSPHILDEPVFPIKFRNGIIRDGKFIPIEDYDDFTPYFIDVEYDPDAEPVQVVDDYIQNLTDREPEYRLLLQEVLGYAMITDPERIRSLGKFFFFRGDGANGKGTLLQILQAIYNPQNCANLSIKQLVDDRYKVTLIGKLANLGDDIEAEAINNDQMKVLKNIATADTTSSRELYKQAESSTITAKLYFTTNSDIKSFEKGYAFKRRVVWMPMFNKVSAPDPYFISKMTTPEALTYWIRLLVEGYKRLYTNGFWTVSQKVEEYNTMYHEANNPMRQFAQAIGEEAIVGRTVKEIKDDFFEWDTEDNKFSIKLFREAVWDLYEVGVGTARIGTKTSKMFMRQKDTSQVLQH